MFVEDLSVFFDVAGGFAVYALRTPAGGVEESTAQAVIFDANGLDVEEFDVVTEQPALIVPASTWVSLAVGDEFTIDSVEYRARQVYRHRDGALRVAILTRLP